MYFFKVYILILHKFLLFYNKTLFQKYSKLVFFLCRLTLVSNFCIVYYNWINFRKKKVIKQFKCVNNIEKINLKDIVLDIYLFLYKKFKINYLITVKTPN